MPQVAPHISGRAYWRSLEEHADSPQFRELLGYAGEPIDEQKAASGVTRRRFLQLMGASMSLAGLTLAGCRRWPEEKLAPYANRPEHTVPGEPVYYASIYQHAGVATGVLVESFDGRPIKLEGNPQHPFSLGATDAWAQASVLTLYDPDRSRVPLYGRAEANRNRSSWQSAEAALREAGQRLQATNGAGLAVLAEPSDSPSLQAMRQRLLERFPQATWYEWSPVNRDHAIAGSRLAFGRAMRAHHHLDAAKIIACFDSNVLSMHPASVRYARDWAQGRNPESGTMNRLYVAEPTFTVTGGAADERLAVRASAVPGLVRALAAKLGVIGDAGVELNRATDFINKLAHDLQQHRGESVVIVGDGQPAETHALAWAINERLGAFGRTITLYEEPNDAGRTQLEQITELTRHMDAGEVDTLLILGGNPGYNAPADLDFADALAKVPNTFHLGLYADETAQHCLWHLPMAHDLEAWGDGRAWDGTASIQQPLIMPLYDGRSPIEVLASLLGEPADGYAIVQRTWGERFLAGGDFAARWRKVLHLGLAEGTGYRAVNDATVRLPAEVASAPTAALKDGFEVTFQPDSAVYDGRWANNGWLQELPRPLTKLTWDNVASLAVADAQDLGVRKPGDLVAVTVNGRSLAMPAYPAPGQARGTIVLTLGYGRSAAGHVGNGVGFNTYTLRDSDTLHVGPAQLARADGHYPLALTTHHHLIDDVGEYALRKRAGEKGKSGLIIREATFEEYRKNPHALHKPHHGDLRLQLFEPPDPVKQQNQNHAWAMTIDMNACLGCSACVIACQAENNVPVVGKDEVRVSREMHWLRIDHYFKGDPTGDVDVVHQPVMCVHCENAPCEQVCPVNAAVHDAEGLNLQVYNRCIGTRYCSNNCPYKVRRFNYFDYHAKDPRGAAKPWLNIPDTQQDAQIDRIKRMVFNPDVTVRMRGVMEKCTYCLQRLSRAKIKAKNAWARGERPSPTVQDGEVQTACQQACPTQAIVFGNLNDPDSRVARIQKDNPRAYSLLEELNTRPRGQHLGKIRNPAGKVSGA